jgi:hypothetical protein
VYSRWSTIRRDSQLKSRGESDNYDTALDGSAPSLDSSATEATSRLFERGYEIHEVQQFTLHSSWQQLLRYTHLRPEHIPDLPYPSAALAE